MPDIKTTLTVTAKPEGFARTREQAGQLIDATTRGAEAQARGYKDATREIEGFNAASERSMKTLMKTRSARDELRRLGDAFDRLSQKVGRFNTSYERGGFFQGLVQGATGIQLQRGPGLAQQAAGGAVGRALAAPGRAVSGAMFQGAGGLVGALQGLPVVGGALAAPLQAGLGFAGQALQLQRQQMQAIPFLGGGRAFMGGGLPPIGLTQAQIGRQARAFAINAARRLPPTMRGDIVSEQPGLTFNEAGELVSRGPGLIEPSETGAMFEMGPGGRLRPGQTRETEFMQQAISGERARLQAANRRLRVQRARRIIRRQLAGFTQGGARFGMAEPEALQLATQLAQAGGQRPGQDMFETVAAAQQAFGIGPQAAGAFQRAGRVGGLAGGPAGAKGLTRTLSEGMRMGLEGTDLIRFMEQMATGIRNFEQTGIPINTTSIGEMGRQIGALGLGGVRGSFVAQQFQRAGQQIAVQGPRQGMDILMMQAAGFTGGGMQDTLNALLQLERGLPPEAFQQIAGRLMQAAGPGGGPEAQARQTITLQRGFQRMGVRMGLGEAQIMRRRLQGEPLDAEDQRKLREIQERMTMGGAAAPETPQALQNLAETMINQLGPSIVRQTKIANEQLQVGKDLIKPMQDLEVSTTAMASSMNNTIGPLLTDLTGGIADFASAIREFTEEMRKGGSFLEAIEAFQESIR